MKKLIVFITLIICVNTNAQKAFGPFNFGMTLKEMKAVKIPEGSNISFNGFLINTDIIGIKFYGIPSIIDSVLHEITFYHKIADSLSYYGNDGLYQLSDFEKEIKSLLSYFRGIAGEPNILKGYIKPENLDFNRVTTIAVWKQKDRIIQLRENNIKKIPSPEIVISSVSWYKIQTDAEELKNKLNKKITNSNF